MSSDTTTQAGGGGSAAGPGPDVPLLRMSGIEKRYAGVRALRGVDFEVLAGEVHGLVGENGAGKSTLIKILSGVEHADAGRIEYDGQQVHFTSTAAALVSGIGTVFQEPQVFPDLTVAENVFVGREVRTGDRRIDWPEQERHCVELLQSLHLEPGLAHRTMGDLSVATWQLVSIAKALAADCRILILDEPSAILTARETETLFEVVRRLTERAVGVIYISHRLDELFLITDRVTVIRDGENVATRATADVTPHRVAELMVGRELTGDEHLPERPHGDVVIRASGLGRSGSFTDIDLEVRGGEIVGLYGLIGSGAEGIALAIYGIEPADTGTIEVKGRSERITSPVQADRLGVALLPADRKRQGLFATHPIDFNISAGNLERLATARVLVNRAAERTKVTQLTRRLNVRTPSIKQRISALSGGNQQKVVLARQVLQRPEVLVLEEPSQGVDVGAKEEIHRIIGELAGGGTAVLVVSSDLPEVLKVCDRIVVLREGRVVQRFERGAKDTDVLAAAAGRLHDAPSPEAAAPDPATARGQEERHGHH
jgi:rhamnose transport system ATP-binding protein